MKFRLIHNGPLRPDKPGMDIKEHKQAIRRRFHRQLKELWVRHDTLNVSMTAGAYLNVVRPDELAKNPNYLSGPLIVGGRDPPQYSLVDLVRGIYSTKCQNNNGYEWVPLVLDSYEVAVELDILLLFADAKPGPLEFGDVDNRVKTLVDALQQPSAQGIIGTPLPDETPFFVLMNNDKLVTKLSVETDMLYRPARLLTRRAKANDRLVHATITVTLRPYRVSMFNLKFA